MKQENEPYSGTSVPTHQATSHGQINTTNSIRLVIDNLTASAWTFSTLASVLEAGLLQTLTEAHNLVELSSQSGIPIQLVEAMLDVLVAQGLLNRENDS